MAVQVDLIESFGKLIKSAYFRKMRSDLSFRLDHTKRVMNLGIEFYREHNPSWNEHHIDLELLGYVHKDFLKKYIKKP